jgi:urease accessory protein
VTAEYLGMLLADGRLPVGAHTQSAGVEPAFQAGLPLDRLPGYIAVRLRTVTEVEAATAVVARRIWSGEAGRSSPRSVPNAPIRSARLDTALHADGRAAPYADGSGRLAEVDLAWRARTPSDALRDASDLLGRGYLRLGRQLWDLSTLDGRAWCRAVVLGVLAAEAGLGAEQTARLVGFEDVQSAIAAALKLRPFDPSLGVVWAVAAGDEVEAMVGRVSRAVDPGDIPGGTAPQIEQWAQLHKDSERRLFRA